LLLRPIGAGSGAGSDDGSDDDFDVDSDAGSGAGKASGSVAPKRIAWRRTACSNVNYQLVLYTHLNGREQVQLQTCHHLLGRRAMRADPKKDFLEVLLQEPPGTRIGPAQNQTQACKRAGN